VSDASQTSEDRRDEWADWAAFLVYGSINVLAAVGGLRLESDSLKARQAAAVVVVVAVAVWLAHTMWRVVRARGRRDPEPERSHELYELLRSWPILVSGLPGVIALLLAALGAWSVATGLRIAQALGIAILFGAGLATARLAGVTRSRQVLYMVALPSVGVVIVLLEVAAHHV
jgi:hypothetical protein